MGEQMTSTTDDRRTGEPARWSRLATFGLLMAAAGPLLYIVAGLAWSLDTEDLGFFVVAAVVALVGAGLIGRRPTALKAIGVVLSLVVGMLLFWTAFGLALPASFFDFVPGLLVLPGALLALVAGIASIRAGRRGDAGTHPKEPRVIRGIVGVVGLLAVVSAVLTLVGRETVSDEDAAAADLVIELADFEFDAASYELAGGSTVLVRNDDPLTHTFTVDALDVDVSLTPGSEKLVEIPDEPGTYVLYCEPHTSDKDEPSEDDMASSLTIG